MKSVDRAAGRRKRGKARKDRGVKSTMKNQKKFKQGMGMNDVQSARDLQSEA